jgi:hypothetical protein
MSARRDNYLPPLTELGGRAAAVRAKNDVGLAAVRVLRSNASGRCRNLTCRHPAPVGEAALLTTVTLLTSRNAGFTGAYLRAAITPGFPA